MSAPAAHMQRALALAAQGRASTHPNPRVGCVIVRDGAVVGEGWHEHAGEPHAEVHALRAAGESARGATAYVTLEPCAHHGRTPPCVDALIAAGVTRVVAAMEDPDPRTAGGGLTRLREAGIDCEVGLGEAEARVLNRGFVSRLVRKRPWLTLKLAMSLDGRTAMADGESKWITGAAAREDAQRLRAEAGAVMTTAATVLADDPQLSVRLPGAWRQPDRIVWDSFGRVSPAAQVWKDGARRFWLTASRHASAPDVETLALTGEGATALLPALMTLAERQVNEVLVESGPRFAGALLNARLVDELVVYVAPTLLGPNARPLAAMPGIARLADRVPLRFTSVETLGDDLKITAHPHGVS